MPDKNLCVVTGNLIVPEECFIDGGAEKMLSLLRHKLKEFVPDPTTPKGLKEIRKFAAKFPKSKTAFEKAGKEFKEQYKIKIEPIDRERKIFRDECDKMRDEARMPLTLHEEEQKRLEEIERQKVIFDLDHEEAIGIDDLFNRERAIVLKEAEYQKMEGERIAKEQAEQAEKDRLEYETRIKKEAEEKATREAEEAFLFQQQETQRWIQEARDSEERAKIDAENAEKQRLKDIEDAEAKRLAALDWQRVQSLQAQQKALDQQRWDQEEKERIEAERLEAEKLVADRKARHLGHQRAVNRKVVAKLVSVAILNAPLTEEQAVSVIRDLVKNPIPEISINY